MNFTKPQSEVFVDDVCDDDEYIKTVNRMAACHPSTFNDPSILDLDLKGVPLVQTSGLPEDGPLPCPWCGSVTKVVGHDTEYAALVECQNEGCDAKGPVRPTASKAVFTWNLVAALPTSRDEVMEYALTMEELVKEAYCNALVDDKAWHTNAHHALKAGSPNTDYRVHYAECYNVHHDCAVEKIACLSLERDNLWNDQVKVNTELDNVLCHAYKLAELLEDVLDSHPDGTLPWHAVDVALKEFYERNVRNDRVKVNAELNDVLSHVCRFVELLLDAPVDDELWISKIDNAIDAFPYPLRIVKRQ